MNVVRSGEQGVDFAFARPPAARLLELGYTFIVGYLSGPPSNPKKNLTADECAAYVAAGLKVLLIWEISGTRANLGATYGTLDGTAAAAMAAARGYPVDVPLLVADDTNTTAANISTHEAYLRAFAAACAPYQIGIYGDTDILARCAGLWRIGWIPNAWSWSGASRAQAEAKARALGAHVLQHAGFGFADQWAVDPNQAISDFPAWGLPEPAEDGDMRIINNADIREGVAVKQFKYAFDGIEKRHMHAEYGELQAAGATGVEVSLSNAALDAIPDYAPPTAAVPIDYAKLAQSLVAVLPSKFDGTIQITAAG